MLVLDSIKDAEGNVIREARLTAWANFRQRALNVAIAEINAKTDLNIALKSLEGSLHGRVTTLSFSIKTQAVPNGDSSSADIVNSARGKGRGGYGGAEVVPCRPVQPGGAAARLLNDRMGVNAPAGFDRDVLSHSVFG